MKFRDEIRGTRCCYLTTELTPGQGNFWVGLIYQGPDKVSRRPAQLFIAGIMEQKMDRESAGDITNKITTNTPTHLAAHSVFPTVTPMISFTAGSLDGEGFNTCRESSAKVES